MPEEAPASIGRYRIERVLGRGAMGVVYQAHDPVIDRKVAIKRVSVDLLSGQERAEYVARFRREAQAAGRCAHSNIVAVYDFSTEEGDPFLVMEFVPGASLAEKLRDGTRYSAAEAVAVTLQVLDALACAHGLGIVHRDVKPGNILLLPNARVKMTDFGIARFDGSELTQHGAVIGTPSSMSPEQCRGEEVDARSDLFSAGTVLHEMLTGARPFPGRNASEVIYRVLNAAPAGLESVPPGLAAVLGRALAKEPRERFPTAEAMASALRTASQAPDETADQTVATSRTLSRFSAAELARAEQALAQYLGPIAKVLVKRAAPQAATQEALWQALADHIERPPDRAAFLRAGSSGRTQSG